MRENEVWIDVGNECGFPYVQNQGQETRMREKDKRKTERHLSLDLNDILSVSGSLSFLTRTEMFPSSLLNCIPVSCFLPST